MLNGRLIVLTLAAALVAAPGFAQPYPSKPLRLLVPFGPGGVDQLSVSRKLRKRSERDG